MLFLCTLVLVLLALPLTLRESFLQESITTGDMLDEDRITRLRTQLPNAGIVDPAQIDALISTESLVSGRKVLTRKCTQCHDLRTVLVSPRTPENWARTVERMVNRSNVLQVISEKEQLEVITYLIAISPTLQNSVMQKRDMNQQASAPDQSASDSVAEQELDEPAKEFDIDAARSTFEMICSQCHAYQLVDARPPTTEDEIDTVVQRMVANGLRTDPATLATVSQYLRQTYAKDAEGVKNAESAQTIEPEAATENTPAENTSAENTPVEAMPTTVGNDIGDFNLAIQSGCSACHSVSDKILGPAWQDVSIRYQNDSNAFDTLLATVKNGGSGNWTDVTGGVSMPANYPRVSEDDLSRLVRFILSLSSAQ